MLIEYADLANQNTVVLEKYKEAKCYYQNRPAELAWFLDAVDREYLKQNIADCVSRKSWSMAGWWMGLHYVLFERG